MSHVDEGVSVVTFCLKVDRQVEVIVMAREVLVDEALEVTLGKSVGNVLNHQGCFLDIRNSMEIYLVYVLRRAPSSL